MKHNLKSYSGVDGGCLSVPANLGAKVGGVEKSKGKSGGMKKGGRYKNTKGAGRSMRGR